MITALDRAIQYMSKRRIGALITMQMNTGLEEYIETGIDLDADVSGELLINILFQTHHCMMVPSLLKIIGSPQRLPIYRCHRVT